MKTFTSFILLTLFTFLGIRLAHAETTVNVKSNTNSSSSNNSSVKSKTEIKITTNGETKEFHSDGTSDIDYTSEDGKTRVSVKNNSTRASSTSPAEKENDKKPAGTTPSPSQSAPTPTVESADEESEDIEFTDNRPFPSSVVERFKSILNGIASRMFNLFSPNK